MINTNKSKKIERPTSRRNIIYAYDEKYTQEKKT